MNRPPHRNECLRQARLERNWTQRHLADQLGVGKQTVQSWERGTRVPSLELRGRLCALFSKTPEQLGLQPPETSSEGHPAQKVAHSETPFSSSIPFPSSASPTCSQEYAVPSLSLSPGPRDGNRRLPSPSVQAMEKNRLRMLKRVQMRWISDVLEHSLYQKILIPLSLREQPEAVENPWRDVVRESSQRPSSPLPTGSHLSEIYDEADGAFLLLGEPGAGKTTLLLELTRTLLERARRDEHYPLPVVFNLSEWVDKQRQPLGDWLVQELHLKYQVPTKLAQAWIEAEQILCLLDGLDEVVPESRTACIETINAYRLEHGFVPIVVCCRSDEYFSQPARLLLNRAIVIQPLTTHQVNEYIAHVGPEVASLRLALQSDPTLQEVASTPLMLNTLTVAYQSLPPDEWLASGSHEMRRTIVFAKYVERVLEQRGPKKTYHAKQVKQFLGWIAHHMHKRSQTELYVERLQPDWLEDERERYRYQRTVLRLILVIQCFVGGALVSWLKGGLKHGVVGSGNGILGLFGGGAGNSMLGWMSPGIGGGSQGGASLIIILSIVVWLVTTLAASPSLPLITPQAMWYGLLSGVRAGLKAGLLTSGLAIPFFGLLGGMEHGLHYGLGIGFFLGMCAAMMSGLVSGLRFGQEEPQKTGTFRDRFLDGLWFGASGALGFIIVGLLLQVSVQSTFTYGSICGLFSLLAYGFGGGSSFFPVGQTIKPAEIVTWSWVHMAQEMKSNSKKSILVALVTLVSVSIVIGWVSSIFFFNLGYGVRYGLVFGTISGLIVGMAGLLTSMLKSGWSSEMLPEDQHTTPNEGIIRSGRNALVGACVFAPIGGIASGLACAIGFGLIGGLSTWPVMGMAFALMLTIMFFVIFATTHGGMAWIEHYTLRWYFWRAGYLPWKVVHFLDSAAKYALMRKVGGGYMFIHTLVLEYFADLYQSGR